MAEIFETELLIKAGVQGLETIAKLASEIEAAGLDVSKLSEEGLALNKTFNDIEQKQGLISLFRAQKLAVVEAATAWQDAQENTKNLSQEWSDAASRADELKAAMEASDEVTREQTAEYNAAAKEVENYARAHAKSATEAAKLKEEYTGLNGQLSQTRQAMADTGLSTTDLAGQSAELQAQSAAATEALAELNAEAESLSEIAKAKIILGIETEDTALAQIEEINQAYELLRDSGTLTSEELAAATELHAQRVQELEESLNGAAEETTDLATEFGKVTAAAGGLTVVAKAAMDFEAAMAGVKKTVDGSPEQIKALSSEIKQLSIDLGISSEAVADIAAQGGQLGIPIEELGRFTEMAGKMSIAFGISAEDAAQSAAELANVFGISMVDVEALGDAINTLGNNTAAKEPDIVNAMVRIGGTAKQFGLAEEQAAALTAAFIALGKTPEVAATAVNGLLTKLQTAQVQGKGFQEALDGIGLSADKLAEDINANPQAALSNFLQTLSNLDEQQRSIATFKLFGQEYSDDVNLLVGSLGTYNDALALTADKSKTAGAMQTEFEAQMSTSEAAVNRAEAALAAITQTLGQHLLPVISATASGVASIAEAVNSFAESYPMITQFVVLIASAKVAMVAFNSAIALAGAFGAKAGVSISAGMTAATTSILGANVAAGSLAAKMTSLSGLFAVAAGWTIGTSIGDSLYENIPAVRTFGDELGRGLAYLDAIVTERTFDDVRNNFETSAESAARLAEAQKNVVQTADEVLVAEEAAATAALEQATANRQLVNDIIIAEANVKQMTSALTEMALNGEANSTAYKNLSNDLEDTKDRLEAMHLEAKQNNLGEMLKSDLDQASESFKALGLDVNEFSTGINTQATVALSAFSEVAKLAEDDTTKLARAYNAASTQVGTNVQAQALLQQQLLASVNGNSDLADEVKRVATEQRNAKSAADDQSAALSRLGINMNAVNQGMSASGFEMVTTLKAGVAAIKEQATSAVALKTALSSVFDTSIAAAQTKEDFKAISGVLREAGVSSQLTASQQAILNVGMREGAAAAREAAMAHKDAAGAVDDQNAALSRLGVSIDAANQKMSKSGYDMVQSLRTGVVAIKEQATSADALKTALTQALDTSLAAAKTQEDFRAIAQVLREAGVAGQVTGEQMRQIEAGMQGGASAAREAKQALDGMTSSARAVKPPVDDATAAMRGLGDEADITGQRMTKSALDAQREFGKLKRTIDDQGRTLNSSGDVLKATSYTQDSAFEYLLSRLGLSEGALSNSERNKIRSKASQMANANGHLRDQAKYGLTNAIQAEQMAEQFVKAMEKEREKAERAAERSTPAPRPAPTPRPEPTPTPAPSGLRELTQAEIDANMRKLNEDLRRSNKSTALPVSAADIASIFFERIEEAKKETITEFAKQLQDELKRRA